MSSNQTNNIYPKSCGYGFGLQIYWNTSENAYFEVFTKKKHICPNKSNKPATNTINSPTGVSSKPTYYIKIPWATTPKPKMFNSSEYLQGSIAEIQRKYEIFSDLIL